MCIEGKGHAGKVTVRYSEANIIGPAISYNTQIAA